MDAPNGPGVAGRDVGEEVPEPELAARPSSSTKVSALSFLTVVALLHLLNEFLNRFRILVVRLKRTARTRT